MVERGDGWVLRRDGVRWSLIDSDGNIEGLAPCWLRSGFDILFPLESGKWGTTPATLRSTLGRHVRRDHTPRIYVCSLFSGIHGPARAVTRTDNRKSASRHHCQT